MKEQKIYQTPCAMMIRVADEVIRTSGWDEKNKENVVAAPDEWFGGNSDPVFH